MQTDRYGLGLSTSSSAAAAAYREGVDLMLSAWPGADTKFRTALEADEGFSLAHAASARLHQIFGRAAESRAAIATARERAAGTSARERSHVEVLGFVIEGKPAKALEALLQHVAEWPRDAIPLSLALGAFGLYAFGGGADHDAARLALCERLAKHYPDDWWFLGHLGWASSEAGKLDAGLKHTARALELRMANANAAHAMGHWHAETATVGKGAEFLAAWLRDYPREGVLYSHLHWHCTLAFHEAKERQRVLELNADKIRPSVTLAPAINRISDGASLLWRLSLAEPLPAGAWDELAQYVATTFAGPAHHFVEWHIAMVFSGTRDAAAMEARLKSIRERERSGAIPTGGALESVCTGLMAFGHGDRHEAAARLGAAEKDFVRLGGSTAQRRILHDTLTAARRE